MAERRGSEEKSRQECWKVMSFSEKVLLFLLICSILLLVGALVYIGFLLLSEPEVCESPTCIKASAELLDLMDPTADPCEDFFQFTCGNYVPLQEDCEEPREPRKAILAFPSESSDGRSLITAKKFYQICIGVDESSNIKVLKHLISQIGGWPLTGDVTGEDWRKGKFHWLKFMTQELRPRGIQSDWLLGFDYHVDEDGTNLLMIGPPDLEKVLNRHKKRHESIALVAEKLYDDFVLEELTDIVSFEQELGSVIAKTPTNRNTTRMTVQELNRLWPEIQLVYALNNLTNGYAAFVNSTPVLVHEYYLYELNMLLRKTSPRTHLNYLIWKIVESYLPFISENFQRVYYERYSSEDDTEDHCFTETIKRFYSSVQSQIINNEDDGVIRSVKSMVTRVIQAVDQDSGDPEVVVVGLQGGNSGLTNFYFRSNNVIYMINEVHLRVENEFYTCLHKSATLCTRETYYHEPEQPEIRFDANQTTLYLSSNLLKSEMYQWDQQNFVNYGRLGWSIADVVVETLQKENTRGVDVAYEAYVQATQDEGVDGMLPAIGHSIKQLFWIQACSVYCRSENISVRFDLAKKSKHFSDDFQC